MRIGVIENDPDVPVGLFGDIASDQGHEIELIRVHDGDSLPDPAAFDAVVVLGGGMGAYDTVEYPFLETEKRYLRDVVAQDIPTLGLCLGGQLLAEVLGGRAYPAVEPEVTFAAVEVTEESDPLAVALGSGRTVAFHRDTFDVPVGACVLARTEAFTHAFRFGSAVGLQPHPEATPTIVRAWAEHPGSRDILERSGVTAAQICAAVAGADAEMHAVAARFFGEWLAEAAAATPAGPVTHRS